MARICIKFGNHKLGMKFLQKSEGLLRFNEKNLEILTKLKKKMNTSNNYEILNNYS